MDGSRCSRRRIDRRRRSSVGVGVVPSRHVRGAGGKRRLAVRHGSSSNGSLAQRRGRGCGNARDMAPSVSSQMLMLLPPGMVMRMIVVLVSSSRHMIPVRII